MKRVILIAIALLMNYVTAYASDPISGESLLKYCQSSLAILERDAKTVSVESATSGGICLGYIAAFEDTYNLSTGKSAVKDANSMPQNLLTFCMPDNVSLTQEVKVVTKYLSDHPQELNQPAMGLLYVIFSDAFPCGGSARNT